MDQTRFDALSRDLAGTTSRRNALRTFAAAGFGLGLAGLGLRSTSAAKKGKNKRKKVVGERCKKSEQCQGKLICKIANSQNYYPESEKRCCLEIGEHCEDGLDCCGVDVICNGGYCQGA
jgi:hypothetical protein